MAIYHCHTHAISRSGRTGTALACAAYRSGEKLHEAGVRRRSSAAELAAYRTGASVADGSGKVHDYTRKGGVAHTGIVLPAGVDAAWAQDRAALWNQAEAAETRINSRVAREWRVALPHELDGEERVALAREFAQVIVERYGVAADVAVHAPGRSGDQRNWHAHILCTTRRISNAGFGAKALIEWSNTNLKAAGVPYSSLQIRELRMAWQDCANGQLAAAGHDAAIDHRSHAAQGIGLEAARTVHVGQVHAEARDVMAGSARILPVERLDAVQSASNAALIAENPGLLLDRVTAQASVFTRADVAASLHRFVSGDWREFHATLERVMGCAGLVRLMEGGRSDTGQVVEDVFSTKAVALQEAAMLDRAARLAASRARGLPERAITRGIAAVEQGAGQGGDREGPGFRLSAEQHAAVRVIAGDGQLALLRGVAGTGKTTALRAVGAAAEAAGVRVVGAALAGKAARELEDGSGIESRTLASLERSWASGFDVLGRGDMLVVDEAGMVGSAQMGRIMAQVEAAGAKLVLVGDERQLQPIEAGAAFRTIKDRQHQGATNTIGATNTPGVSNTISARHATGERDARRVAELGEVRRQAQDWQRAAAQAFGRGEAGVALDAYQERGHVRLHDSTAQTHAAIVRDYFGHLDAACEARGAYKPGAGPEPDHMVTAYRNVDVDALNAAIRNAREARGELGAAASFRSDRGAVVFAAGDRVLLTRNDRELGVANGDRGAVIAAEPDRVTVRLKDGRTVGLDAASYDGVRHGYAVTLHRAQGMTVDRVHVMAGQGMHASLAYVAMTRQRDGATLHASRDHFRDYATLRESISRERRSAGVGDYLPQRNALAAVQARIAESDRTRQPQREQERHNDQSVDPNTAAPSRLARLRAFFGRGQGVPEEQSPPRDEQTGQQHGRDGSAGRDRVAGVAGSQASGSRPQGVQGPEAQADAVRTPSARDPSDGRADLRQRLRDHAAGQGGTQDSARRARLRERLAEHAAGQSGGAAPSPPDRVRDQGAAHQDSAEDSARRERLRERLSQHAAGQSDGAAPLPPDRVRDQDASRGSAAGSRGTGNAASGDGAPGRDPGRGRDDDTGAGR